MRHNIDSTHTRQEEIHKLADKSTRIEQDSHDFRIRARDAKRKVCMSNLRWWFIVGGGVALVIIVVVAVGKFQVRPQSRNNCL